MWNLIFILFIFSMGITLFSAVSKIFKEIDDKESTQIVKNSVRGLLVMGVVFFISAIAYGVCHWKCNCGTAGSESLVVYGGFMTVFGIVTAVLSAQVKSLPGDAGKWGNNMMIASIIFALSSVITIGVNYWGTSKYKVDRNIHSTMNNLLSSSMEKHSLFGNDEDEEYSLFGNDEDEEYSLFGNDEDGEEYDSLFAKKEDRTYFEDHSTPLQSSF